MSPLRSDWLRALERLGVPISPALRATLSVAAHTNPSLDQAGFRGRNDDGSETTATWKAAENTNWTQAVDETFRARVVVDETAGGAENNVRFTWQYNLNGAGWNEITTTSLVVRAVDSPNLTEDEATTRQLGSGAGTFLTGRVTEDGNTDTAVSFAGGELTETELAAQIRSADVVDTDSIQLRVIRTGGVVLESYAQTPTITVSEAATGQTVTPSPVSAAFAVAVATVVLGAVTLTPTPVSAAWSIPAPVVQVGGVTLSPAAVSATYAISAPTVQLGGVTLTPTSAAAAWSIPPPTVSTGGAQTVTPTVASSTWSVPAPTAQFGPVTLTPSTISAGWGVATSTVALGPLMLLPTTMIGAWAVVDPNVAGGGTAVHILRRAKLWIGLALGPP